MFKYVVQESVQYLNSRLLIALLLAFAKNEHQICANESLGSYYVNEKAYKNKLLGKSLRRKRALVYNWDNCLAVGLSTIQ